MKQNIVIALLAGIIAGQNFPRATAEQTTGTITREDLVYAAAIAGICANQRFDPSGRVGFLNQWKGPDGLKKLAKVYATE